MKETESTMKFITNNTAQLYFPSTLINDSAYPFPRENHRVVLRIEGKKIVVENNSDE
jgi:hypothetical protein